MLIFFVLSHLVHEFKHGSRVHFHYQKQHGCPANTIHSSCCSSVQPYRLEMRYTQKISQQAVVKYSVVIYPFNNLFIIVFGCYCYYYFFIKYAFLLSSFLTGHGRQLHALYMFLSADWCHHQFQILRCFSLLICVLKTYFEAMPPSCSLMREHKVKFDVFIQVS